VVRTFKGLIRFLSVIAEPVTMQDRKHPPMRVEEGVVVSNRPTGTDQCRILKVQSPEIAQKARAGQFVMVRLLNRPFPYLSRPFTIADLDPDDPDAYSLAFVTVGKGTRALAEAAPGDTLGSIGPLGNGFEVKTAPAHVFLAGGIGSAPFPLLSREISRVDPVAPQLLLLGAASASSLHLAEELQELGVRVETATMDGSEGFRGTVVDLVDSIKIPAGSLFYACGPNPMLAALAKLLENRGHHCQAALEERMACGFGACNGCAVPVKESAGSGWRYEMVCTRGPVFDLMTIQWDLRDGNQMRTGSSASP